MTATVLDMPRAVSWKTAGGFSSWHISTQKGKTACGLTLANVRTSVTSVVELREVRGGTCRSCIAAMRRALVEGS